MFEKRVLWESNQNGVRVVLRSRIGLDFRLEFGLGFGLGLGLGLGFRSGFELGSP